MNIHEGFNIRPEVKEWLNNTFECRWGQNCDLMIVTSKYYYAMNGKQMGDFLTIEEMKKHLKKEFNSKYLDSPDTAAIKKLKI